MATRSPFTVKVHRLQSFSFRGAWTGSDQEGPRGSWQLPPASGLMFHRVLLAFYLQDKEPSNQGVGGEMGRWQWWSQDGFSVDQMSFLWSQSSRTHTGGRVCVWAPLHGSGRQCSSHRNQSGRRGQTLHRVAPARPPWEDGAEDRAGPGTPPAQPSLSPRAPRSLLASSTSALPVTVRDVTNVLAKSPGHVLRVSPTLGPAPPPTAAPSRGHGAAGSLPRFPP